MSSLISKIMGGQIRLLRPVLSSFSIKTSRVFQEKLAELAAKALEGKVHFEDFEIGDIPATSAVPLDGAADMDEILLYIHGGGYVTGELEYARGFSGLLAMETGRAVCAITYRLAPENPYPAALEDVFCAYQYLLRFYEADRISLIGESAGGGLILALCHKLKDEGLPLPSKLVPISPWTDLTLSGKSYMENRKTEPTLTFEEIEGFVQAYSPDDLRSPYVSPLFGDFTGFPPSYIFVGGDELLLDDSVQLYDKMITAGVLCHIMVGEGMWHAYVLYPTPESSEARDEIRSFLEDCNDGR